MYGGAKKTRVLLTLGTPHYSLERYLFGRVSEKLFADAEARADFEREAVFSQRKDSTTTTTSAPSPPDRVRAAEHAGATNFRYPGAFRRACGTSPCASRGRRDPAAGSPSRCVYRKRFTDGNERRETQTRALARPPRSRRWARASRAASCGSCDGVDGDGVTPLRSAMLRGATEIVLEGHAQSETDDDDPATRGRAAPVADLGAGALRVGYVGGADALVRDAATRTTR